MHTLLRVSLLLAACGGSAGCRSLPPQQPSVASRLAAQNAIFEAEYQFDLKMHPLHATEVGDYRYNDRLGDLSLRAVETIHSAEVDFLSRLERITTNGFGEQDRLSHDVMVQLLQQHLDDYGFKEYEMPVSQIMGPQLDLADLPLSVPFDSVKHYEDYIARLHQVPHAFAQTKEVLRAGRTITSCRCAFCSRRSRQSAREPWRPIRSCCPRAGFRPALRPRSSSA